MNRIRLWRQTLISKPETAVRLRRWLLTAVILGLAFVCLALTAAAWLALTEGLYQYPNSTWAGAPNFTYSHIDVFSHGCLEVTLNIEFTFVTPDSPQQVASWYRQTDGWVGNEEQGLRSLADKSYTFFNHLGAGRSASAHAARIGGRTEIYLRYNFGLAWCP